MNTAISADRESFARDSEDTVQYLAHDSFSQLKEDELLYMPTDCSIYADNESGSGEATETGDYETLRGLPLLSVEGETFLFRKMNYLKFRAEQLRTSTTDHSADQDVRELLEDADSVRNHIAECNLRLVISIARKFCTSVCDFDELMSEGNEILLKAISKFDFSRGFRFSTYATHSIQRHFFRYTQRRQKRNSLEFRSTSEVLNEIPNAESDASIDEWVREEQRMTALLGQMADRLNEREHQIVTARFGLNPDGVVKTLRELSAEMGLSKERVRQLQIVAVEKLRGLFDELDREIVSA